MFTPNWSFRVDSTDIEYALKKASYQNKLPDDVDPDEVLEQLQEPDDQNEVKQDETAN